MQHRKITITGQVQGVGFRAGVKRRADELGLHGFVRNEPDGSVYIEAEGTLENLDELVKWCQDGTDRAVVESVDHTAHQPIGHSNFDIIY